MANTPEAESARCSPVLGFNRNGLDAPNEEFSGAGRCASRLLSLPAKAEPASPRRAHQPSRSRSRNWLKNTWQLSLRVVLIPTTAISGCHRRSHRRNLEQEAAFLRRQLRSIPGCESRAQEQLESAYKTQRDRIEQLEVFTRFSHTAPKAKQVQSRIKDWRNRALEIPKKKRPSTSPSRSRSKRPHRREFANVAKSYGRGPNEHKFSPCEFHESSAASALPCRSQWGREVHLIKLLAHTEPLTAGEYKLSRSPPRLLRAQKKNQYKELDPKSAFLDDLESFRRHPRKRNAQPARLFPVLRNDVFKRIAALAASQPLRAPEMLLHPATSAA